LSRPRWSGTGWGLFLRPDLWYLLYIHRLPLLTTNIRSLPDPYDEEAVLFEKCIHFLQQIGIATAFQSIDANSFLPGFSIDNGVLHIDRKCIQHPGDILHEAGHIAVVPAAERAGLCAKSIMGRQNREAEEMMAIAWSYAACIHLQIDPYYVFHEDGYRGGSQFITDSCSNNQYFGLPMLEAIGLTASQTDLSQFHIPAYPHMLKWLRG
jgi:hypothetical protein